MGEHSRLTNIEDMQDLVEAQESSASSGKGWLRAAVAGLALTAVGFAAGAAMGRQTAPMQTVAADHMRPTKLFDEGRKIPIEAEPLGMAISHYQPHEVFELGPEGDQVKATLTLTTCRVNTPWMPGSQWNAAGGYFITRCYNGKIPGPEIVVKPGDTLTITFKNDMDKDPAAPECTSPYKNSGQIGKPYGFCLINSTNMHTHGLHADPAEDNALLMVYPGETRTYTFHIPLDHMPGTHWIHPHLHHSVGAQLGGGAHAFLIVKDPAGYIPSWIPQFNPDTNDQNPSDFDKAISLWNLDIATMMRLEQWSKGKLWVPFTSDGKPQKRPFQPNDDITIPPKVLVGGKLEPSIPIFAGKWYRFRFLYASIEMTMEIFNGAGDAVCNYELIAKDGVYLHHAPRHLTPRTSAKPGTFHFAAGSRADIMTYCYCPSGQTSCKLDLQWRGRKVNPSSSGQGVDITDRDELERYGEGQQFRSIQANGKMFTLQVSGSASAPGPIEGFAVNRPCYLVDLCSVESLGENQYKELDMSADDSGLLLQWRPDNNKCERWSEGRCSLNRDPFYTGRVYEINVQGCDHHPFHLHTSPFQVCKLGDYDEWTKEGDWHDVLMPYSSQYAKIRVALEKWSGVHVIHCHTLEHEDAGMAGFIQVDIEDLYYKHAKTIGDGQCFRHNDVTPGSWTYHKLPAESAPERPPPAQGGGGGGGGRGGGEESNSANTDDMSEWDGP